ncbi:MAG: hypothetical protein J0L78_02400 [Planctomycetes bacterium]|nr:hypothetical protein [Planctomycetota bacterium]
MNSTPGNHPKLGIAAPLLASLFFCMQALAAPLTLRTANEVSGVRILEPQKWGVVRSVVANESDREELPFIVVQFEGDPLRQFRSRVWIPAGSVREVLTPVRVGPISEKTPSVGITTRLQGLENSSPTPTLSAPSPLTRGRFESAVVTRTEDAEMTGLVGAIRKAAGLKPTTFLLNPGGLPASPAGYEAVDSIFAGEDELDLDPMRRDALLGFVERGGRLWIALKEGQTWPEKLLGDRWGISILDWVDATHFVIKGPSGETPQELDKGVRLARVCAPGFEVTHSINGFPAALRRSVGRGQIVVTTLAPGGWLDPAGAATPALADLQAFVAPPEEPRVFGVPDMRVFDPHIRAAIGHEIVQRSTVLLVLGLGVGAALIAAAWAARMRRLELASVAIGVIALGSGGVLVGIGRASQTQTPSMSATDQLVLYAEEPGRAEVFARSTVYLSPDEPAADTSVLQRRGGTLVAERSGSGAIERTTWTGSEDAVIDGLDLRPGASAVLTVQAGVREVPEVRATVGADARGVRGRLELGGMRAGDRPLLVTPAGSQALEIDAAGGISSREAGAPGALQSTLQSEEQIARARVVQALLEGAWYPNKPVILLWNELLDIGVKYPAPEKGNSLRAIPVRFEKPKPGSEVSLPSVLLSPEPIRGDVAGRKSGVVYDSAKRTWLTAIHQPMLVMKGFRPPDAFATIDVSSAVLTLDLRAPGCAYEVVIVRDGKLRVVDRGSNPVGPIVLTLTGENAPQLDESGRVLVGVDIRGDENLADGPGWSLRRMELSVRGRAR